MPPPCCGGGVFSVNESTVCSMQWGLQAVGWGLDESARCGFHKSHILSIAADKANVIS